MKAKLSEADFTKMVIEAAHLYGWHAVHFRHAKTSKGYRTPVQGDGVGFPDLMLFHEGVIIFAELKVGKNRLTEDQAAWLERIIQAKSNYLLWYPENWEEIIDTLKQWPLRTNRTTVSKTAIL